MLSLRGIIQRWPAVPEEEGCFGTEKALPLGMARFFLSPLFCLLSSPSSTWSLLPIRERTGLYHSSLRGVTEKRPSCRG